MKLEIRIGLIYKATSPSGKVYVGQTTNLHNRINCHKSSSFNLNCREYNLAFHKAIRKYGFENIQWTILEDNIPEELLSIKECEWIQGLNSLKKGYNETIGGEQSPTKNPEVAKKISLKKKGIGFSKEALEKSIKTKKEKGLFASENNPMYGKKHKEDSKKQISNSLKGRVPWNKGKKMPFKKRNSKKTQL